MLFGKFQPRGRDPRILLADSCTSLSCNNLEVQKDATRRSPASTRNKREFVSRQVRSKTLLFFKFRLKWVAFVLRINTDSFYSTYTTHNFKGVY